MREVTIREANQNLSRLISEAERGETICITRHGQRVARIMPEPAGDVLHDLQRAALAGLEARLAALDGLPDRPILPERLGRDQFYDD